MCSGSGSGSEGVGGTLEEKEKKVIMWNEIEGFVTYDALLRKSWANTFCSLSIYGWIDN